MNSFKIRRLQPGDSLDDLTALGASHGLGLSERIAMPANNLVLVFRKDRAAKPPA